MVVASNFLVQNANNMSLTKKNNNNNNNNNNDNDNEGKSPASNLNSNIIKLNADAKDKDGETADAKGKAAAKIKAPCCMLMCRDNSHPFTDRVLSLDSPVKIGRTVQRVKASMTNAIFDCKVLSRHHALLSFKGGKFYLQDTKSSNGTFVNNQRLSATNELSTPREVCSGDIVQFGVNVLENSKNVQHGCIIATLRLYLPDGTEAKASNVVSCPANVSLEDLYKLNQYLQEAGKREKILRYKLSMVQRLVDSTRKAADQSWKAYIDEDKLLSRIETVEGQLVAYSKNFSNDKIREELARLQEEKAQYQKAAKESLRKVLKEKLELSLQLEIYGCRVDEVEQDRQNLRQIAKKNQAELQEFATKYSEAQKKISEVLNKLAENEDVTREVIERTELERDYLMRRLMVKMTSEKKLHAYLRALRVDLAFLHKQITSLKSYMKEGEEGVEVEQTKYVSSMMSEIMLATLNKLNSMVEMHECLEIEDNDEDDSDKDSDDERARLDKIRNSIEAALISKIDLMLMERINKDEKCAKIEELGSVQDTKPQSNGMIDKVNEQESRHTVDTNVSDNASESKKKIIENSEVEKLIEQVDAEKTEDISEKFDSSMDGAESDVTEIEISQRDQSDIDTDVAESLSEMSSRYHQVKELTEVSPRVKHERQQRAVEEELAALREKCRTLEEQEAMLAEKYANLKNHCGDLLNANYMVPIQYFVPITIALLWMLLEKIF